MRTLLLASATVAALTVSHPASAYMVYVANEEGSAITTIDTENKSVRETAIGISPHNIEVSPDGTHVLAVGIAGHGHDMPGMKGAGQLVVLDAIGGELRPTATIEVGGHPAHVVPSADGTIAYVTDAETDAVLVVDLASGTVTGSIKVGRYPHGLRPSPDGTTLAVADMKSDTVSFVTVATGAVRTVPVPGRPVQVAFAPDGRTLWVSQNGNDSVAAVDAATGEVRASYPVGDGPVQVFVTRDGARVLVANQGTAKKPSRTVSVLDAATGSPVAAIEVGRGAHGVSVTPDGRYAFATNSFEDSVSEISLATLKEVRRYPVGRAPNGVTSR